MLGTYAYMSPEQKRGEEADERSDLYAVGLMAFRLLTGYEEVSFELPTAVDDSLAKGWDNLVRRGLRPSPARRFRSAADMLEALGRVRDETAQDRRSSVRIAGLLATGRRRLGEEDFEGVRASIDALRSSPGDEGAAAAKNLGRVSVRGPDGEIENSRRS
jgi:serine/threonine-protein kinase